MQCGLRRDPRDSDGYAMSDLAKAEQELADALDEHDIGRDIYLLGRRFLRALDRADVVIPSICADPDGEASFDWDDPLISISLNADGRLAYAGPHGHGNAHFLQDLISPNLLDLLPRKK